MCTDKKLSLNKCETLNLQQKPQLKSDCHQIASNLFIGLCLIMLEVSYAAVCSDLSRT